MSKFRLWLSRKVYQLLRPALYETVERMTEAALCERRYLSADIRAFILDDLNERIPVESTTHSLAVHVRDQAKALEGRIVALEEKISEGCVAVPVGRFREIQELLTSNVKRR